MGGLASCVRARGFYKGVASLDFWCRLKLNFKIWFWWIKICVERVCGVLNEFKILKFLAESLACGLKSKF